MGALKPRPNVALIVETSVVYGRQILHGVSRYLKSEGHARGSWSVFLDERELLAPPPDWLLGWDGDGVICRPTTPELARVLAARGLPAVDLNDRHGFLGLPRISSDMAAVGRLAAQHLLERGFRDIAFCGFSGEAWSRERLRGVREAVRQAAQGELRGVFESPWAGLRERPWQDERGRIASWLRELPRPLGIVACNDARGHHVLDACRYLGLAVPEEVAVVGVDNAETFCELCDPPLSSVVPDAERIGFEAAALLDRLMRAKPSPQVLAASPEPIPAAAPELRGELRDRLVGPRGVITRQSSDVLALDDPAIARAVRFIRERACEGISAAEVSLHARTSRSALERGFRRLLGHSPQEEIRHVRLKRIKQLLAETDWPLARIAEATGYEHPEYMMVQFKRAVGQTPSQWRQHGGQGISAR